MILPGDEEAEQDEEEEEEAESEEGEERRPRAFRRERDTPSSGSLSSLGSEAGDGLAPLPDDGLPDVLPGQLPGRAADVGPSRRGPGPAGAASAPVGSGLPAEEGLDDPWNLVRLAVGSLAGESWRMRKALVWPKEVFRLRDLPDGTSRWEEFRGTQSFDDFKRAVGFRPNSTSSSIDVLIVGDAEALELAMDLEASLALVEAFLGFKVLLKQDMPLALGPWARPRRSTDGFDQVGAHFVLAQLEGGADTRATCTVGVTTSDLYPPRAYEFVTGITDTASRVGLFSVARYFPGEPPQTRIAELERRQELTLCMAKALARECLKLCGAGECRLLHCLMNPFPAGPPEAIARLPFELCCICLRKLHWITQADLIDRFARLPSVLSGPCMQETERLWQRLAQLGMPTYASMVDPPPLAKKPVEFHRFGN